MKALESDSEGEDATPAASSAPSPIHDPSGGAVCAGDAAFSAKNGTVSSSDSNGEGIVGTAVPAPRSPAALSAVKESEVAPVSTAGGLLTEVSSAAAPAAATAAVETRLYPAASAAAPGAGIEGAASDTVPRAAGPDPARQSFTGWQRGGPLAWNGGGGAKDGDDTGEDRAAAERSTRSRRVARRPSRSATTKTNQEARTKGAAPGQCRSSISEKRTPARKAAEKQPPPAPKQRAAVRPSKQQVEEVPKIRSPASPTAPSKAPPARKQGARRASRQQLDDVSASGGDEQKPPPRRGRASRSIRDKAGAPAADAGSATGEDAEPPLSQHHECGTGPTASTASAPAAAGAAGMPVAPACAAGAETSSRCSNSSSSNSSCGLGLAGRDKSSSGITPASRGGRRLPLKRGPLGSTAGPGPAPKSRRKGGGAAAAQAPAASPVPPAVVARASPTATGPSDTGRIAPGDGGLPRAARGGGGHRGGATQSGDQSAGAFAREKPEEDDSAGGATEEGAGGSSKAGRGAKAKKTKSKKAGGDVELRFLKPDEDHAVPLTPTPTFYLLCGQGEPALERAPVSAVAAGESCFNPVQTEGGADVVWDPRRFVVLDAPEEVSGSGGGGGGDDDCGRCCGLNGSGSIPGVGRGAAVQAVTVAAAASTLTAEKEGEASPAPAGPPAHESADKGKVPANTPRHHRRTCCFFFRKATREGCCTRVWSIVG